jgi:hypothetical protein
MDKIDTLKPFSSDLDGVGVRHDESNDKGLNGRRDTKSRCLVEKASNTGAIHLIIVQMNSRDNRAAARGLVRRQRSLVKVA